ncbi:hypothetical protein TWF569_011914 [Orbilia oligospora]|uniref:Uncharacterized protein n=1 Tax=Orbilia oligospora TaxID=2813651 RepID=A0A7C8JK98_ORBOL|nr:hypothetical protein TWF103_000702 [Orbilia oligospora]KAF3097423.1 hypothetical protein TWF102_006401 [Orbilia oligospora]KAF3110255.1 hypothetical protein TWF706_000974 [Orbilia oligospora]KAF3126903.1 hypothetical protein TWF569_011914 [Orbilia oligospora]KAF3151040.1 hypothetical protein TWF594_008255 [Orbilia oligospora]
MKFLRGQSSLFPPAYPVTPPDNCLPRDLRLTISSIRGSFVKSKIVSEAQHEPTYTYTYIYIYTYIHTYIHTYSHTHIHHPETTGRTTVTSPMDPAAYAYIV